MKSLRTLLIILVSWLALLYSSAQYISSFRFGRVTWIFVFTTIVAAILSRRRLRIPLWTIIVFMTFFFLGMKVAAGELHQSTNLPFLIIEILVTALTTYLSHLVANAINEFETTVAKITIGGQDIQADDTVMGPESIYREVRRARNHQRPLALMAVAVEEKSIKVALDRMVKEAQAAMMRQYVFSGVSKTLTTKLEDCSILIKSKDHFLVVLPETSPEDMPRLVKRLRKQIDEQVGVEVKIGAAYLPQDGLTFEGLVEKATQEMVADAVVKQAVVESNDLQSNVI